MKRLFKWHALQSQIHALRPAFHGGPLSGYTAPETHSKFYACSQLGASHWAVQWHAHQHCTGSPKFYAAACNEDS